MLFILDTIGFIISIGAAVGVAKTVSIWQGAYRSELKMITGGFFILAAGFVWEALAFVQVMPIGGNALLAFGMVPLALGATNIFGMDLMTKTPRSVGEQPRKVFEKPVS